MPREQLGEPARELVDRKRRVGAEALFCAIDPFAQAVPDLALGVFRADEHHEPHRGRLAFVLELHLRVGHEHDHRLGLVEAGQVEDVGVLAKVVLDVVVSHGGGGRDEHRRGLRGHRLEEALTTCCE